MYCKTPVEGGGEELILQSLTNKAKDGKLWLPGGKR